MLALGCIATRRSLRFSLRDHAFLAGVGLLMICINYNLIYWAERMVVSGLVAVVYSTFVFMTPVGMRIAFGVPMRPRLLAAAALGVTGVAPTVPAGARRSRAWRKHRRGHRARAGGDACVRAGHADRRAQPECGDPDDPGHDVDDDLRCALRRDRGDVGRRLVDVRLRPAYVLSLAYLATFGSVIAFVAYFALLKRVGAAPSSYISVATPVIAILLSTVFEGYRWTPVAGAGLVLAVAGISLALRLTVGVSLRRPS